MRRWLAVLVLGLAGAARAGDLPFVAHNSYGKDGGVDRLEAALSSGLSSVEVDITWGIVRHRAIVTHDRFHSGLTGPELSEYLKRVWSRWEGAPGRHELFIDVKTGTADTARRLHEVLAPHAARLSTMTPDGAFHAGAITVYLTGSPDVQRAYETVARARGTFLAFGEYAYDKNDWKDDPRGYVPTSPPGYRRFVNMNCRLFLAKRAPELDPANLSGERLAAVASGCAARGYPVRVWVVNARGADTRSWDAMTRAGIPMIATDEYARAVKYWAEHGRRY